MNLFSLFSLFSFGHRSIEMQSSDPKAVAGHFGPAAISVVDVKGSVCFTGGRKVNDAIGPDPLMTVADGANKGGQFSSGNTMAGLFNNYEVVSESVVF